MSSGYEDLKLTVKFCKPITRNKKDLYEYLDKLEIKPSDPKKLVIFFL